MDGWMNFKAGKDIRDFRIIFRETEDIQLVAELFESD